ncbi:selenide, water dikinase [Desulfofustis limnaeus]|uniref:Selenide, water dikinase n=1 Tax=Desulfofustis limnaeus TaxID=2740163 RepID=A0ABM7W6H1_9BACT|nr:selenide, water dikinase [Desulfofustis limnaeus]
MCGLDIPTDERVLIGIGTADDAGVYLISEDLALIQTVDFFTPIVDDPFSFGRIAAANALSDVYAMGGQPKTAMNIVAFPVQKLAIELLRDVLAGGMATLREAGVALIGGHSIEDDEFKYGLSVSGFVHPQRILANQGLRQGDLLILTKPLGTGIINTAIKGGLASEQTIRQVTEQMVRLNADAAAVMADFPISACTDVTGFGLLGHLAEMISGTTTAVRIDSDRVPLLAEAVEFARIGFVPAGAYRNKAFRQPLLNVSPTIDPILLDVLFDPQTSGGLLLGCPEAQAEALLARLQAAGVDRAAIIGGVVAGDKDQIIIS